MSALQRDLGRLVGDDAVTDEPADRSAYAHDLWPRQLIATRGGLARPPGPAAVVWPSDREALARVLDFARSSGLRVTPFGAGSAVTGALSLEPDVIAIDTKRMRALHRVDLERGLAVADAGILGEHLEEKLAHAGATLGHFPSSIYCSTLGGWIATRSAGQCSGRYGKIEDMVVALEGVLPTGEPFACGPPRAGRIDARALMVGSEGLFGFITRATMRVWPAPSRRRFASYTFATLPEAWSAVRALYQAGLRPAVARIYDPFDTYIFRSGGTRSHTPSAAPGARSPVSEFVFRRALAHPGWLNRANARLGERVFGRSLLVLVFEATPGEPVDDALAAARALLATTGARDTGEAPARRWLSRRHAVSYRQPPTYAKGLWVDTMEVAAPWSRLEALYHGVREALSAGGFVMAHLSHAYPDGCSIYFTFAGASPTDREALARYTRTWQRALTAAHAAGGTIAHHHGVGRSKRGAMRLELGQGVELIDALGRAADPHSIVARGALVPEAGEGPGAGTPPEPPAAERVRIDALSRLCEVAPETALTSLHAALEAQGFVLPDAPAEGTIATWLASQGGAPAVARDPVDHRVAGYTAVRPGGGVAYTLPAPRRSAGPELFELFARGGGRFGTLASVTLRVHGRDERGPAWYAPVEHPASEADPAIDSWLARATARAH